MTMADFLFSRGDLVKLTCLSPPGVSKVVAYEEVFGINGLDSVAFTPREHDVMLVVETDLNGREVRVLSPDGVLGCLSCSELKRV